MKRQRRSIADNLWQLLGLRYWNYAAWIILRGEYKAMKKTLPDNEVEKRLKEHYSYLSQVKCAGWFEEVKGGGNSPLDLADRDTAEALGLDQQSFHVILSPKRLRGSPPASLIAASTDSKKLLSKLKRILPSRRTSKDRAVIRLIEAEVHPPKTR